MHQSIWEGAKLKFCEYLFQTFVALSGLRRGGSCVSVVAFLGGFVALCEYESGFGAIVTLHILNRC